jgi:small subunit ribosomal protein S2
MAPFIFEERNGIHIIDLQKTQRLLDYATQYVRNVAQKGGRILFVGTKRQIRSIMSEEAQNCGMPYVSERWLGGMLTNMQTVRQSIGRLEEIEELENSGVLGRLPKKEQASLRREMAKLRRNLDGVRAMAQLPEVMFVVDVGKEHIAVAEARKLGLTIVAITDTNCDPEDADFIIPGNDDAISSVRLVASAVSKAVQEGVQYYKEVEKERKERAAEEREKRKAVKPTARKPRSAAARKLQEELSAKADASATPTEETAGESKAEEAPEAGAEPAADAGAETSVAQPADKPEETPAEDATDKAE